MSGEIEDAERPDFLVEPLVAREVGTEAKIVVEAVVREVDDPLAGDLLRGVAVLVGLDGHAMSDLADQLLGHDVALLGDIPDPVHRSLLLGHRQEIGRE